MLMLTFLHWHFFFIKNLPYFPVSQHYFAGEHQTKREICGNSLSVWPDPTGRRHSTVMSTEVSIFYFCDSTHTHTKCTHTSLTHRLNEKHFCSLGSLSSQSFVPLYFLPVSILCYHQHLWIFLPIQALTDSIHREAAWQNEAMRETMDTSLLHKQD